MVLTQLRWEQIFGHSGKCVFALTSLVAAGLVQLVGRQVRRRGAAHVPVDIWIPAVAIAAQMMLFKITLWGGEQQTWPSLDS